ncbi:response regulator transcription factor [uncultured Azohydromonas sp.]|jgi:Response regulators consisting of a CheY-like receiver domain and a winged-helix DNA-binding domain|uniref:response regulator n=1 Tax=uncultured Azohydromonas sp. TaxID=487342 RepID=UPI00262E35E2|nr:response regulator transcription factor [uncultured Azohydromonas sp.]
MVENASALIYIVEDDAEVARLVEMSLRDFGFACENFGNAAAVLRRLQGEVPDLCIVDLGLPDMDGIELVREIARRHNCGMLVLTGRGHTVDRVMALEGGGDDYVVKPFEPRELIARVRSILRRRGASVPGTASLQRRHARFAGWSLDCAANLLRAPDGTETLLGTAEAQVLRTLLERPHQILTREQLMGARDLSPLDRSIDVRISRLRRKFEADPQNPKIIKTVYGAGYMLVATVEWS